MEMTSCRAVISSTGFKAVFTHESNPDIAQARQRAKNLSQKKKRQIDGPHGILIQSGLRCTRESLMPTDRRLWA